MIYIIFVYSIIFRMTNLNYRILKKNSEINFFALSTYIFDFSTNQIAIAKYTNDSVKKKILKIDH